MDIKKLTDLELKAYAYDSLSIIELHKKNLDIINQELDSRAKQTQQNKKMEEEVIVNEPAVEEEVIAEEKKEEGVEVKEEVV